MKERTKEELHRIRCENLTSSRLREIIDQLIAEIEKPKVWDGAPDWATFAIKGFGNDNGQLSCLGRINRTLPKTRAREIAEEEAEEVRAILGLGLSAPEKKELIDLFESAILRREKELEEGRC
jgi:hypothetical protein